jgi:AcrR family transcriptional regulator
MKPRKLPRQSRSKATVKAILDTTAHILISEGYAALNTNRVAELAGVSIGSLYQYFPDKKSLLVSLRRRHLDEMNECMSQATSNITQLTAAEAIPLLITTVFDAHLVDPLLHRAFHSEVPQPLLYDKDSNFEASFIDMAKQLLMSWQGQIQNVDVGVASVVLVHLIESLVHAAIINNDLANNEEDIEPERIKVEIINIVTRYLILE